MSENYYHIKQIDMNLNPQRATYTPHKQASFLLAISRDLTQLGPPHRACVEPCVVYRTGMFVSSLKGNCRRIPSTIARLGCISQLLYRTVETCVDSCMSPQVSRH